MKKIVSATFTLIIFVVLMAKTANWFLNFNEEINQFLNVVMFSLIGLAYLVMAYVWDQRLLKLVIAICGIFLIAMNLVEKSITIDIIGIVCILTPMLVAKFQAENIFARR
ncbi:MAG TPA: hypothetical protein VNT20_02745 [Flavisolibacter sp.]|nr:hypothetical protein [Flavisolibacter sp.]